MRRRAEKLPTVPSLLVEERTYNPFLRVHVAAVKSAIAMAVKDPRGSEMPEVPALAALRRLKDRKAHLPAGGKGAPPAPPTTAAAAAAGGSAPTRPASAAGGGDDGDEDAEGLMAGGGGGRRA